MLAQFSPKGEGRVSSKCKSCNALQSRQWREKNRTRHREYQRQYARTSPKPAAWAAANQDKMKGYQRKRTLGKYGLTPETFDQMFVDQGSKCAICATDVPGGHGWHVDHCHATGRVRGILCSRCNPVLSEHLEKHWLAFETYLNERGA